VRRLSLLLLIALLVTALAAGCDGYLGRSRKVRPDPTRVGTEYEPGPRYLRGAGYLE